MEHVNHPKHYNSHPNGIECIDIIRHYVCDIANAIKYLWRAGLKPEMGKDDAEKEIEDLKKALWYIDDFYEAEIIHYGQMCDLDYSLATVERTTGHKPCKITEGYEPNIGNAIKNLLPVGITFNGEDYTCENWRDNLDAAAKSIRKRIAEIESKQ